MNINIQNTINLLVPIFEATETSLTEWSGEGNLQLPVLLGMVAVKLNWDDEKIRQNDPLIRAYVRNHSDWYITRGAHGGIMRRSEKEKKDASKAAKEAAKAAIKAAIDSKVSAINSDDKTSNNS